MPLIASEDYPNKRIYLSIETVGVDLQPINVYVEHRERRRLNVNEERSFRPMVSAFGNQQIGPSKFTQRLTDLRSGVKIIPYDTTHNLRVTGTLVSTDDGLEGRDLFDRAGLMSIVDIDYQPPQVEIITVATGGALTDQQATQLANAAALLQADERIRSGRYQKLTAGTTTVILDKDVSDLGNGEFDVTEHTP